MGDGRFHGSLCYAAAMRSSRDRDDTAVIVAWFLWEMFLGDTDDAGAQPGSAKSEEPPAPAPRPAKKR